MNLFGLYKFLLSVNYINKYVIVIILIVSDILSVCKFPKNFKLNKYIIRQQVIYFLIIKMLTFYNFIMKKQYCYVHIYVLIKLRSILTNFIIEFL